MNIYAKLFAVAGSVLKYGICDLKGVKFKMKKSMKLWGFIAVLAMVTVVSAVMASADITSESDVKSSSGTIYVPDNYTKIQWAIDNATAGGTIIVRDGTYTENVNVYKRLTIKSENGSKNCIVQAATSDDHVFEITANYVNISGFTVQGAMKMHDRAGIYLNNVDHCTISENIASNSGDCGIYLSYSNDNILINNTATSNGYSGLQLYSSSSNTLINNNASSNPLGINLMEFSSSNTLTDNTATSNTYGISLSSSNNNALLNNIANSNIANGISLHGYNNNLTSNIASLNGYSGILLSGSSNSLLINNTANLNGYDGIFLSQSSSNTLANNTASSSSDGIALYYSSSNTITNNIATSNGHGIHLTNSGNNMLGGNIVISNNLGIYLEYSNSNNIYDNYFNNTNNAYDDGNNIWNITKTPGTNIIGGPYLGGNYWSDYSGEDTDEDGIGDTLLPYSNGITTGGDWLPLTPTNISVETSTGTGTAYFSTDSGLFADINGVDEDSLPQEAIDNKPVGLTLPHGLFSFTITGLTPGQSVTLTITLPGPIPIGSLWWKVNTTAGNNTWYSLPIGDDDGDNVVTITLTDGGLGDNDGAANGVIVDPSGIGIPKEVVAVPILTPIGLLALIGLLSVIAVSRIKRRDHG